MVVDSAEAMNLSAKKSTIDAQRRVADISEMAGGPIALARVAMAQARQKSFHTPARFALILNPAVQPTKHMKSERLENESIFTRWVNSASPTTHSVFVSLVCFVGSIAVSRLIAHGSVACPHQIPYGIVLLVRDVNGR